jgi:membrane associated rhomboid family serine protease
MAAIIPFSDDAGYRRKFPFVNYALILANIAVFVYELSLPDQGQCFTQDYALIPSHVLALQAHPLAAYTACSTIAPVPVAATLITAMFLHASLLHIGGNMLYLWVFGDNVEDRLGHFWYLVVYLLCGLAANAAQIAATVATNGDLTIINLGASGAIAGVLGAYLIFYPAARVRSVVFIGFFPLLTSLRAYIVIGFWFLLELLNAYLTVIPINGVSVSSGGVAYFAHVGGFVLGLFIALMIRLFTRGPGPTTSYPAWPAPPGMRSSQTYR